MYLGLGLGFKVGLEYHSTPGKIPRLRPRLMGNVTRNAHTGLTVTGTVFELQRKMYM